MVLQRLVCRYYVENAQSSWCREAGEGNDLSTGLKRPLSYAVDLRRLPSLEGYEIPEGFWGNAVTANFVQACELPANHSTSQPGHLLEVLASAACAIRIGTNTVQGDPGFRKTGMSLVRDMAEQQYWKELSEQSGPHPFKDAAALYTGWRSGSVDRADFGHGTPWVVGGVHSPISLHPHSPFAWRPVCPYLQACAAVGGCRHWVYHLQ